MRGLEQIPWLYDAFMVVADRFSFGRWRTSLVEPSGGPQLEVGCGTGRTLALFPEGTPVIGLDPDAHVLKAARERSPRVPLVQARAEALPFRDGTFDAVITSLSFCSVDDPERGLAEIARTLAPGGRLRMFEHVRPRWRPAALVARWVQPAWTTVAGGCRPDRDTEATVRRAGFRIDPDTHHARGILRRFDADPPSR